MSHDVTDPASLIGAIYDAGLEPQLWPEVLHTLRDRCGGSGCALHIGHTSGHGFEFGASVTVDPDAMKCYERTYHQINPLNQALVRVPAGRTVLWQDLVRLRDLEHSQFHSEYLRPFHIRSSITSVLQRDREHVASLGIISDRPGHFDCEQARFLDALVPHLARAIDINRRLHVATTARDGALATLDLLSTPVFLVAADGRVEHANPAAEDLVARGGGLELRDRRLSAGHETDRELKKLLSDASCGRRTRGGRLVMRRRPPLPPLTLNVDALPSRATWLPKVSICAAVFVSDPEARPKELVSELVAIWGLTAGEARIVAALAEGLSPNEAAASFGLSRTTVRNHLASALRKTNTSRQADLVRAILASRVPVR